MITKMDKYSFVLFHAELDSFLENIRQLGMIDITRATRPSDETSARIYENIKRYANYMKRLDSFRIKASEEELKLAGSLCESAQKEDNPFDKVADTFAKYDALIQETEQLRKEKEDSEPWGEFDSEDISRLKSAGLAVHFYSIFDKGYKEEWNQLYCLQELNRLNGKIYFALVSPAEEEIDLGINEAKFPARSYTEVALSIVKTEEEIRKTRMDILACSSDKDYLTSYIRSVYKELDTHYAKTSSVQSVEGTVSILSGFAPAENAKEISEFLSQEGCFYISEASKAEDKPPIKLKNNKFAKLFEPIGEMYMMPTYGELDLTQYFAPFYMLFFGFCFGDLGYGLLLLIGGGFAKLKFKQYKNYLNLIQFLGLGTVLMATVSGTFFGTKLYEIFPIPEHISNLFFTDLQMFWLAIIFGLVQIIFARFLRAIDNMLRYGWQYGLSNIGWGLFIIWASVAYAQTMIPDLKTGPLFNYLTCWLGLALIILFSETSGNIFARLGKGAFALYDITGVFGDMLSYIRLFGLGTSGGILGLVVNSVAIGMLGVPYVGWLLTILMLLIGHTAVLALSSLGAFVHPMRLTFVEFYKNMGFVGGGKPFNPLRKI
jgi:V/A-type H+-transporting ATPase subunit I